MVNCNAFLKSSILLFFLISFLNCENPKYIDFNFETYSTTYEHTDGSKTQTVICEFANNRIPTYLKVTVTPKEGYETPLMCFSPTDQNCNKDRYAVARRTDGKPATIFVKGEQFDEEDLELNIYLSCASECKYTLLFEGSTTSAIIDSNIVFTYVVTNKNKEMVYEAKGDLESGFLTIGIEGSRNIQLLVDTPDDRDYMPYNLDTGRIITIPISKSGTYSKFTIKGGNVGDFLTLNVYTVVNSEVEDNFLYPNGPVIMGMLTKLEGYFIEECFPVSSIADKFSNVNKFYLSAKIHSKYGLFWLTDENNIYMSETDTEIPDGQLTYLIETNGKKRSVCFEFSYEQAVDMGYVAYSISLLEPTKLDNFYNFNPPLTIGEIYRKIIPKGGYAVYAGGKIEATAKRYNFNLYNRKGVAEMIVEECTSYPNCIYSTDSLKSKTKVKRINKMSIYEAEVKSEIEALDSRKQVMIVYCRDDDNENNGYCEFEASIAPVAQTISLVENEKFYKYVIKGDKGTLKFDFKGGMKIQRFTLDIMVHSGDVTFKLNSFSTKSNKLGGEQVDISHYKYFLSNKIFYHVNLAQLAFDSLEMDYSAELNSFFTIQFGLNPTNLIQLEETVESGESYLVEIDPSTSEKYKIVHLKNYRYKMNKPFLANFFALNCEFKVTRGENEISFYDGYAQEILKSDTKGYASEQYDYKIEIVQADLSNYNHKMCMLYVAGYESKDSEYETEIVVGENVNQQVIFNDDFKTVRFLYPQADPSKDLAIYANIIDQAYYNLKIYTNADTQPFKSYTITRSQIYYISKSNILSKCNENTLCNIIVEATYDKKINSKDTDEPMIEITIRQIKNTPSYLQKSMAKKDFTCGDSYYFLYTDIGKNEKGDVTVNFLRDFGNVWGKIVRKDKTDVDEEANWRGIYRMPSPEWDDDQADGYTKKFAIDLEKTQECIEGCYLLLAIQVSQIGDYVDDSKFYPFSIITRITPNQHAYTDTPKIVIQVNEFIVGNVDKADNERIYQFYELWFPHDSYRIDFDFQSEVAGLYINVGGTRPTTKNADFKLLPPGRDSVLTIDKYYLLQKAKNKKVKIPNENSIQDLNIVIGIWTDKVDSVDTELFSLSVRLPNDDYLVDIIEVNTDQKVLCTPSFLNDNLFRCLFMITYDEEDANLNMPLLVHAASVNQSATTNFYGNFIDKAYYDEFDTNNLKKETPTLETAEFSTQKDNLDYFFTYLGTRKGKYFYINVISDKADDLFILTSMPVFNIDKNQNYIFYPNPSTEQLIYVPKDQIILQFFTSSSLIANIVTLDGEAEISWKSDSETIYNLRGSGDRLSLTSGTTLNELVIKKRQISNNPNFIFYISYYVRDPENNFDEVQYGKAIEIAYRETDLPVYLYSKVGSHFNDMNIAVTFRDIEKGKEIELTSSPFVVRAALAKESSIYKAKDNPELSPIAQKSLSGSYDPALQTASVSFSRQNILDFNVKSEDNPTLYLSIEKDDKFKDLKFTKFNIVAQFSKINSEQIPLEKTYNYGKCMYTRNFVNYYRLKKDKNKKYMKIEFAFNSNYLNFAVSHARAQTNNTNLIISEYKARGKTFLTVDTTKLTDNYVFLNIFKKDNEEHDEKLNNYVFKYLNYESESEFTDYKILNDDNELTIDESTENNITTIKCTFNKIDVPSGKADITYFFKVVDNATHVYGEEIETIAIMESPYYTVYQKNPSDNNGKITLTAKGDLSNWVYLQVIAQIEQETILEYVAYKGKKFVRPSNGGGNNGENSSSSSEGISTTVFVVVAVIILGLIAGLVVVVFIFQQRNKSLLNQVKHVSFQQNAGNNTPANADPDLLLQKNQPQ